MRSTHKQLVLVSGPCLYRGLLFVQPSYKGFFTAFPDKRNQEKKKGIGVNMEQHTVVAGTASLESGSSITCTALSGQLADITSTIDITYHGDAITGITFSNSSDSGWEDIVNSNQTEMVDEINHDLAVELQ